MFFTRDAGTAIFHTNIIATTKRSLLFLPFFTGSSFLYTFTCAFKISNQDTHIQNVMTCNLADRYQCSTGNCYLHTFLSTPSQAFPLALPPTKASHLFSVLKLFFLPPVAAHFFFIPFHFSAQPVPRLTYSPGFSPKSSIFRYHNAHSSTLKMEATCTT